MKLRLGRRAAVIAGSSVLVLAGGGAAFAATSGGPVDSSGLIHGCYSSHADRQGSHSVALQDSGSGCPRGTTPISWNQKGQTGQAGARGPAGAGGAPVDYGLITIYENQGAAPTYTCADFTASGPDAGAVKVSPNPSIGGCQITGLDGLIESFQLTPQDGPPVGCEPQAGTVCTFLGGGGDGTSQITIGYNANGANAKGTFAWAAFLKS